MLAIRKKEGVCKRLSRKSAERTTELPTTVAKIKTRNPNEPAGETNGFIVDVTRVVDGRSVVDINDRVTL